mmetsp:Transcript_8345/g.18062  ORF Transcript_8345/g.18062 Transcript_8345/m.18062 type:complete len:368 (-) Transcript_8345:1944-3047(-)
MPPFGDNASQLFIRDHMSHVINPVLKDLINKLRGNQDPTSSLPLTAFCVDKHHPKDLPLVNLIQIGITDPIERYMQLIHGPTKHLLFTRFLGQGLQHTLTNNWHSYKPRALPDVELSAAAICGDYIMETGLHYASFTFYGCNGDGVDGVRVDYEIGVMRPLSPGLWDAMASDVHSIWHMTSNFYLYREQMIEIFNRDRYHTEEGEAIHNPHWRKWNDCCTISPRATWRPWRGANHIHNVENGQEQRWGRVTCSYWDSPRLRYASYTESIPTWYERSNALQEEEAGLLLDLDNGILWFCKNGQRQFSIGNNLCGQYVFVVSVHQARERRNGDPPVYFECKTFFDCDTSEDESSVNTRAEFASFFFFRR